MTIFIRIKVIFARFRFIEVYFQKIQCLSGLIAYLAWRGMRRHNNYRGMRVFTHRAHVEGLCRGWHTQLTAPTMIHLSHRVTIVTYLVVTDEKAKIFVLPFFALEKYRNWWSKGGRLERICIFLILLDENVYEILTMYKCLLIIHNFFYETLIKLKLMFFLRYHMIINVLWI